MIVVNLTKAKALALKLADQIEDAAQRIMRVSQIDQTQDLDKLAAVVKAIKAGEIVSQKTTVENTAESAEGGSASASA